MPIEERIEGAAAMESDTAVKSEETRTISDVMAEKTSALSEILVATDAGEKAIAAADELKEKIDGMTALIRTHENRAAQLENDLTTERQLTASLAHRNAELREQIDALTADIESMRTLIKA